MENKKKKVALFIDHDNIRIGLKNQNIFYDLNKLIDRINEDGVVVAGKSYITLKENEDMSRKENFFYEHFKRGIDPVFTPLYNEKSLGDPILICDCMEILYDKQEIDMFVIVSGDKDMIPLIRQIAKKGKDILVIGVNDTSANALIKEVNRLGYKYEDYESI